MTPKDPHTQKIAAERAIMRMTGASRSQVRQVFQNLVAQRIVAPTSSPTGFTPQPVSKTLEPLLKSERQEPAPIKLDGDGGTPTMTGKNTGGPMILPELADVVFLDTATDTLYVTGLYYNGTITPI